MSYEAHKAMALRAEAQDARLLGRLHRDEPCTRCDGTGLSPLWRGARCARCLGTGRGVRPALAAPHVPVNLRLVPALPPIQLHAHDGNCEDSALD